MLSGWAIPLDRESYSRPTVKAIVEQVQSVIQPFTSRSNHKCRSVAQTSRNCKQLQAPPEKYLRDQLIVESWEIIIQRTIFDRPLDFISDQLGFIPVNNKIGWELAVANNCPFLSLVEIITDIQFVQSHSVAVSALVQSA